MQIISIKHVLELSERILVDTRSPSEFEQGHIPGAVNIPLLDNDERVIVGTLYKQKGPEEAKEKGLEIVSHKLSGMVKSIATLMAQSPSAVLVVYCWRGGMRSKAMLTILELMGIAGTQLIGGYKAYRTYVQERLMNFPLRPQMIVLCGSTGVGKTILLQQLAQRGYPVINLEALANHRGSAFGQIGLGKSVTAQNFDASLLQLMECYNEEPYIFVECESKRIGNVYLPPILYQAMQKGRKILVKAGIETRVIRLIAEYANSLRPFDPEVIDSITSLTKRLGKMKVTKLISDYESGKLDSFTRILLEDYYDLLYGYETTQTDGFDIIVDAEELEAAAGTIATYIDFLKRR
jgi:tRNA 2-selenouridine synthase